MDASPRVSPLRQRMIDDMRMRKLSPQTQSAYIRVVRQFTGFLGRLPDTATVEDLRRYQLHLVDHGTSPARSLPVERFPDASRLAGDLSRLGARVARAICSYVAPASLSSNSCARSPP